MPIAETTQQKPSISVVIPTYNAAHCLGKALNCLAPFKNIIISDGGSSDTTCDIAKEYGATLIQKAKGRGQQ